jgi:hypothetical protein
MKLTWDSPPEFQRDLQQRYGLTCPPRWGTPRHPQFPSYGAAVGRVMSRLGTPPMPWQQYVLDVALEVDPSNVVMLRNADGLLVPQPVFVHRKVGLSVCRQQGKTAKVLGLSTHRLMHWAKFSVTYAAQTRQMAREKWEDDFCESVMNSRFAPQFHKRSTNGFEALINKRTRSMMGITSNTEKAGHGDTLDLGLIDEAFSHEDFRLEQAMGPAMITRPMAQLWWLSAGGTERSVFLNRKREDGRAMIEEYWNTKKISNIAYFEWYPDDSAARDAFETWLTCMPALCPNPPCHCDPEERWKHTVTQQVIQGELDSMEAPEFDRAYLNRTKLKTPPPDVNIPTREWPQRANPKSRKGEKLAFAVDITPQRDKSSIAMYSLRDDGKGHGELVAHRPGWDWVPGVLLRLRKKWNPVAIGIDAVSGSPAGAMLDRLLKAVDPEDPDNVLKLPDDPEKPEPGQLWIPDLREVVSACGQIVVEIRQGKLEHPDQVPLNVAVSGARTRPLGDAWAFARKSAIVNISPIVALTLARAAYLARVDKIVDDFDPGAWYL